MLPSVLALATALALGTPAAEPIAQLSMGILRAPDLALHLGRAPEAAEAFPYDVRGRRAGAPVCSGDVCQPVVSVPGFEPGYAGRDRRSEAFVALLTRARVEPLATMAWALLATGLRLDYSPPIFDGGNAKARGWGSFMLRLRLRIDAQGVVAVPPRPR